MCLFAYNFVFVKFILQLRRELRLIFAFLVLLMHFFSLIWKYTFILATSRIVKYQYKISMKNTLIKTKKKTLLVRRLCVLLILIVATIFEKGLCRPFCFSFWVLLYFFVFVLPSSPLPISSLSYFFFSF